MNHVDSPTDDVVIYFLNAFDHLVNFLIDSNCFVLNFQVSFYTVTTGQTPTLLKKYERKTANHIFWSPSGQFVVLAGLRNMNGVLEFIDTSDFTSMNSGEHFMCTDIEWDPTGR